MTPAPAAAPDPSMDDLAAFLGHVELYAAFDAVAGLPADLVLFERDSPTAPEALRHWAARSNRSVIVREVLPDCAVLSVETCQRRHIDVHLVPGAVW